MMGGDWAVRTRNTREVIDKEGYGQQLQNVG